jgi:anti-sigma factor ChrR (cupin superfamily)
MRYDSVHGRLNEPVTAHEDSLEIGDRKIQVLNRRDPGELPWADLGVDVVIESTGVLRIFSTGGDRPATAMITRRAPGAHGDLHEHLDYELMFVLAGELRNDNGDRYTVGDLILEAPGSIHQVSTTTGCTVLGIRQAPTIPRG